MKQSMYLLIALIFISQIAVCESAPEQNNKNIQASEKNNVDSDNFSTEQDAEFDRIIDAMSNDGVIQFQKLTPLIVLMRRVGGYILVKYLTVKNYVYNFIYGKPQPRNKLAYEQKK